MIGLAKDHDERHTDLSPKKVWNGKKMLGGNKKEHPKRNGLPIRGNHHRRCRFRCHHHHSIVVINIIKMLFLGLGLGKWDSRKYFVAFFGFHFLFSIRK